MPLSDIDYFHGCRPYQGSENFLVYTPDYCLRNAPDFFLGFHSACFLDYGWFFIDFITALISRLRPLILFWTIRPWLFSGLCPCQEYYPRQQPVHTRSILVGGAGCNLLVGPVPPTPSPPPLHPPPPPPFTLTQLSVLTWLPSQILHFLPVVEMGNFSNFNWNREL